tara:strand:+ start:486 stop:746 length:261 start_codon:yes stop_codon:yes gene_type:complete
VSRSNEDFPAYAKASCDAGYEQVGMSIRTAIAMNIMAGFPHNEFFERIIQDITNYEEIGPDQAMALYASELADALIAELNKNGGVL